MRRPTTAVLALAVIAGLTVPAAAALPSTASAPLPASARCAAGTAEQAAVAVFGAGTELVRTDTVAGLPGALVLEPRIAPGTRARLLQIGDAWCEASSAFNSAWQAADRSLADSRALAAAYASVAAAPYFDDVTVQAVEHTAGGVYTVRTHAGTNGVDATWTVHIDRRGIVSAAWTATAFGVQPFEPQFEGLTALPGGSETYTRLADGLLSAARGLPTVAGARAAAAPSLAEYVSSDDFRITVSLGDTRVAVDPDQDTGVRRADIVRETLAALKTNYEEFQTWGFEKGWGELEPVSGPDRGYVYINDALSFYCFACVFIADDFQIHLHSEVEAVLGALGYTYPDGVKAYANIVGHEMFHNFQNRYNKPGPLGRSAGRGTPTAYSEGTARAQETLHSYSDASFQPDSLVYANDSNGCNGFDGSSMDNALAAGIFGKTYNACFFWLSWYAAEGVGGLNRLVETAYPTVSSKTNVGEEGLAALALASDVPVPDQLARFAAAALTGRGYELADVNGVVRDWGQGLDRWQPASLDPGRSATATLGASGLFARDVLGPATITLDDPAAAMLFVVTDDGETVSSRVVPDGTVEVPAGSVAWVGALRAAAGSATVTLSAR